MSNETQKCSGLKCLWRALKAPTSKYSLGFILLVGIVAGVILWGGFNTALELSNTETFCISCHEMEENVYKEYKNTIHYNNRSGVRATCPDCHVPKEWHWKLLRKVRATNELFHKAIGSVDTPEKFEAKRLELAKHVWEEMEANDSRECRNCHSMTAMDLSKQKPRARGQHESSIEEGETCIDCHKGIAHKDIHKELEKGTEQSEEDFLL